VSPVKYEKGSYIPEGDILHSHRRENLKSYKSYCTGIRTPLQGNPEGSMRIRLVDGFQPWRPSSSPGPVIGDLWWTERQWAMFFPQQFGVPCKSFHRLLRGNLPQAKWTQYHPTPTNGSRGYTYRRSTLMLLTSTL
jgi:hypothetical protein